MASQHADFIFIDLKPDTGSFLDEVVIGLAKPQKALSPKYFYDARGSALFEAICALPEYYPTRTEIAIMQERAAEIAACIGADSTLIEYGSGSGRKTRILIAACRPAAYIAIDISESQLRAAAAELAAAFPAVEIAAVCADYTRAFALPAVGAKAAGRRVIYFPGSTIGNFSVPEARAFLRLAREQAGPGGGMLVGVDLKKDAAVLDAAYNDASGTTARFNLNLLARMNRELAANFDLDAFRHRAFYDPACGRVEMHLVSLHEQQVRIGERQFQFAAGETIHTENSYKYGVAEFQALARECGFEPRRCWTDSGALFSLHYLAAAT